MWDERCQGNIFVQATDLASKTKTQYSELFQASFFIRHGSTTVDYKLSGTQYENLVSAGLILQPYKTVHLSLTQNRTSADNEIILTTKPQQKSFIMKLLTKF